jgi:sedoheptulose-bisphosphatase
MCTPIPTADTAAPGHLEASAIQSRRDSLAAILRTHYGVTEQSLIRAIHALGEATAAIQVLLTQYVNHEYAGSQNASGDDQLLLDIACDEAVFAAVRASGVYATVASEETPHETPIDNSSNDDSNSNSDDNNPGMRYSLGCDPLDGSSIIDANFSVGSIYGIWPGTTLVGRTGREQVASAVALYGPRTVLCLALVEQAVVLELTLVRHEWHLSRERIHIQPSGKIFAPGNLRATADHAKYRELFQYWMSERYQLRYSGGMVPDVYHILAKSKGIFTNVSSPSAKAKLRLLYEVAPMGLIVELAGGEALFETEDKSVLDITIEHCDHRVGVCFGGTAEVAKYKEIMFS